MRREGGGREEKEEEKNDNHTGNCKAFCVTRKRASWVTNQEMLLKGTFAGEKRRRRKRREGGGKKRQPHRQLQSFLRYTQTQ